MRQSVIRGRGWYRSILVSGSAKMVDYFACEAGRWWKMEAMISGNVMMDVALARLDAYMASAVVE